MKKLRFNDDVVCFVLYQHAIVLPHWNNIGLSSTQTYYSDSESCSFTPQCCVLNGEAAYTNFFVFALTRPTLESTIYHPRVDYANHYTIDDPIFNHMFWLSGLSKHTYVKEITCLTLTIISPMQFRDIIIPVMFPK